MNLLYNGPKIICRLKFKEPQLDIWIKKERILKQEFWKRLGIVLDFLQSLVSTQAVKLMPKMF